MVWYIDSGDDMRLYYVFNVKSDIAKLYKNKSASLYKILENIYYMHQEDINYGFAIFKQITNRIKVMELSNELYIKLHKDLVYSKINNEHIINDLYHDEVSVLKIKNSHMIIESNKSYSSFFNILNEINNDYFVCDFKEKDFFFMNNVTNLIKN